MRTIRIRKPTSGDERRIMKYCIYCGKSLNDVAQFCEFCGKKQLSSDDVSQNSTEAETGEITNQIKIIYAEPPSKEKVNEPIQREPVEYTNTNVDNNIINQRKRRAKGRMLIRKF